MALEEQLDRVFSALSDPTRRAIVGRLSRGSQTVGELARPFSMSAPAISKHIRVLERAGLIGREVRGREHHCRLNAGALKTAEEWINFHREFWETRLDALQALLRSEGA